MKSFDEIFGDLPDPRADNAHHELVDVLFLAFLATLCGATSCSDMEEYGLLKETSSTSFAICDSPGA